MVSDLRRFLFGMKLTPSLLGLFVYKAIVAGRHFNLLALACICATFVAVDGPLLQKSSTVERKMPQRNATMVAHVVPELLSYYTGAAGPSGGGTTYMNALPYMQPLIQASTAGKAPYAVEGCPGSCSARIRGPALAVDSCTSSIRWVNYTRPLTPSEKATYDNANGYAPGDRASFVVNTTIEFGEFEKLVLTTIIADHPGDSSCAAFVNTTTCYLRSAIAEYPVVIAEGGTVEFDQPQPYPEIIALANNTALTNESIREHKYGIGREMVCAQTANRL